jgi:hypothetical protein
LKKNIKCLFLNLQTRRSQQTIAALVRYAVRAKQDRQLELLPRLLSYIRHLPAFQWDPVILNGNTNKDENQRNGNTKYNDPQNRSSSIRHYHL